MMCDTIASDLFGAFILPIKILVRKKWFAQDCKKSKMAQSSS